MIELLRSIPGANEVLSDIFEGLPIVLECRVLKELLQVSERF